MSERIQKYLVWLALLLAGLNFLAWVAVFQLTHNQYLAVYFFDIGQGDSIFIQTPRGRQILIDGGPNQAIADKLSQVLPFWDRQLDLIISTHPDKDHLAGLVEVLRRYQVDNVLSSGVAGQGYTYEQWLMRLELEKARQLIATNNLTIKAGELSLRVLYPLDSFENQQISEINNTSLVLRASFGDFSVLLTGDAEKPVENILLKTGQNLTAQVLKVGHHGSKFSSQAQFLTAINPELAIISVGQNSYGHPHQEVLDRLGDIGAGVLRTDELGDIKLITDGKRYEILNKF